MADTRHCHDEWLQLRLTAYHWQFECSLCYAIHKTRRRAVELDDSRLLARSMVLVVMNAGKLFSR